MLLKVVWQSGFIPVRSTDHCLHEARYCGLSGSSIIAKITSSSPFNSEAQYFESRSSIPPIMRRLARAVLTPRSLPACCSPICFPQTTARNLFVNDKQPSFPQPKCVSEAKVSLPPLQQPDPPCSPCHPATSPTIHKRVQQSKEP